MPLRKNYYGFCDRLWVKCRYENGELRGPALMQMIADRILQVPAATLVYAAWPYLRVRVPRPKAYQ
jgi:hypothetical protein